MGMVTKRVEPVGSRRGGALLVPQKTKRRSCCSQVQGVRDPEGIDAFGEESFERLLVRASGDTIELGEFNAPSGVAFHEGITVELAGNCVARIRLQNDCLVLNKIGVSPMAGSGQLLDTDGL